MSYDILSIVEPISSDEMDSDGLDDYVCFLVDPDVVYPATLSRLSQPKQEGFGQELFNSIDSIDAAKNLVAKARRLKEADFELAAQSRKDLTKEDDVEKRKEVLELARHWFSRALRIAVGKPIGVKISKSETWRL